MWLITSGSQKDETEASVTYCDQFLEHFVGKIARIHHALEVGLVRPNDAPTVSAYPVIWDSFQLVQLEDVGRILRSV